MCAYGCVSVWFHRLGFRLSGLVGVWSSGLHAQVPSMEDLCFTRQVPGIPSSVLLLGFQPVVRCLYAG